MASAGVNSSKGMNWANINLDSLSVHVRSFYVNDVEGMLEQNALKKSRSPSLASLRNGSVSPNHTDGSDCAPLPYRARRHTATADELLYPTEVVEPAATAPKETLKAESGGDEEKKEKNTGCAFEFLRRVGSYHV
ncbi:hypothetical protein NECAME_05213 [Necator americanus]|uniref:Uncharacterized protein n=1 Tax=Necator americanus TaxID=51031 RepID=W2SIT2_NECAM|nr:hypothetical protein NECAME_05213 [Necator americanus]ETN69500.1 hypothetical protein NECAME_05213 [Necator americanus]